MQILNWLISKLVGHKNAYNLQRSHTIKSQHKQKAENNMHKKNHKHKYVKPLPQSKVTVYFMDNHNHLFLDEPRKMLGYIGKPINLNIPTFKNYIMEYIHGFNSVFTEENQQITICYRLKNGSPVSIYYVNFDTYEVIKPPDFLIGTWGNEYHVVSPQINGYKIYSYTGWLNGTFNDISNTIIFYYRNANWQTVSFVQYFINLKRYTNSYNNPNGYLLRTKLPENSTWKVFLEIKTNNGVWLNLGGNQWIKDENLTKSKKFFQNKIANKKD
ncbi:hypothetical protein FD06_GL001361 [Apilactobacillus ozensis DSM 23829 = JCM 17196]|uniref:MucBP domain-containing protein n=1 Tax=Apilactobacillus ozensis DSM 23829 = JCM 17196 TaxID=1423781 RepID=A0A0R2AYV3_9LACO|nr:MucBP domain-containing protein [Apilactobacillus ozensis]KRM68339.1 hypothetical protein FD06_GL001361 [Apilactobacillus ozensis DSM 23829 = JCM 17196]